MDVEVGLAALVSGECEAAKQMWDLRMREAKRYANLIYLLLLVIAAVAAVAIVALLVSDEYGLGIISALGTVVGGGLFTLLLKMRSDAIKEASAWIVKIKQHCGEDDAAAMRI